MRNANAVPLRRHPEAEAVDQQFIGEELNGRDTGDPNDVRQVLPRPRSRFFEGLPMLILTLFPNYLTF